MIQLTKAEFIETINKDGKFTSSIGITYTIEDGDETIYARRDGVVAFCTKSSEINDWYLSSSIGNFKNTNNVLKFMRDLSEDVGYDFSIEGQVVSVKVEEKVVEKEVPSNMQYELQGMVTAYEKILLNRELNVSK